MKFALAIVALAAPLALAQSNPLPPTTPAGKPLAFAIVSIKRHGNAPEGGGTEGCYADGCHFAARPLLAFIMVAYNLSQKPILGDPLPGDSDLFDLNAKIDPADMPATPLSSRQLADMLQSVLADRFQLSVHHETRTRPLLQHRPRQRRLEDEGIRIARWRASHPLLPHVSGQRLTR